MKRTPLYLLALLLLLSACKNEGGVKVTVTVTTPNGQRADTGTNVYFMPTDKINCKFLTLCVGDTTPDMIIALEKEGLDIDKKNIAAYESLCARKDLDVFDKIHSKNMLKYVKEMNKLSIEHINKLQRYNDSASIELATFIKGGIKQTTNTNGVCEAKLMPGKYRVLIESNTCRKKSSGPVFDRYSLDSVIIQNGLTTTLTKNITNCKE